MAIKDNIVNKKRIDLAEVIPLDFPFSVFIDVCNACNFKCKFCAIQTSNEKLNFKKQVMNWELYKKVVDDIYSTGNQLKMLRLTANGEPLMCKDLAKMIRYARKDKCITEHIEIVTNGSLFTHEITDSIIDAGIDRIRISIEAPDKVGYKEICGADIDWEKFIENLTYLYNNRKQCEIYIKTVDAAVAGEDKETEFYKVFEPICDKISIEHVIPIWTGYDKIYKDFDINRNEGLHGHSVADVRVCPFPFYSCVVNPDGQVTACCNDWKRGIILGDMNAESFIDIWRGGYYRDFLIGMLEKGRKCNHSICRVCEYPNYDAVDILDGKEDIILSRYR